MQDTILEHARAVLSTTPAHWQRLAEALPLELLTRPPAAGEWPALACLQHLVDTEEWVFPRRVEALLEGRDFAAFDPDAEGRQPSGDESAAALATAFAELRGASLQLLARVSRADLARTARHSELGEVTMAELLNEWAAHDLMHTVQAERALMQPFIAGCGPWRSYFREHEASGS